MKLLIHYSVYINGCRYTIGRPLTYAVQKGRESVTDLIRQVSQLLRAELEELVDITRATIEPIKPCDEEW